MSDKATTKQCQGFNPLVNSGDYKGTICCTCGENEAAHKPSNKIKSGRCPYCGAKYTLAAGGCVDHCQDSERVRKLVEACAAHPVSEQEESERGL